MTTLRADNKRLTQSVAELRADRRAQDRKIRDLEHQVALLQEKQLGSEPVPVLPVEVMAPPTPKDSARVVGISSDGTEIVYEGDAAVGRPAIYDPARPAPPPAPARAARAPAPAPV